MFQLIMSAPRHDAWRMVLHRHSRHSRLHKSTHVTSSSKHLCEESQFDARRVVLCVVAAMDATGFCFRVSPE